MNVSVKQYDVIILGAGAAGLMCAIEAGNRRQKVLVLDQANKAGKKILMSGGGRCNFTNYHCSPDKYQSHNPHFCKSALSRYTQWDFIERVKKHRIPFHEKTLGQLFCDNKSQDIVNLLLKECELAHVEIRLQTSIERIEPVNDRQFRITTSRGQFLCLSLVIATGGLSIPTMGSSPFAYKIAEQFGIAVRPTRAGLVPFTLDAPDRERFSVLSGVAVASHVENDRTDFRENMLFTHRGLSGPAMLQLSSWWHPGETIRINLLPDELLIETLKTTRSQTPNRQLIVLLHQLLPRRVVDVFTPNTLADKKLSELNNKEIESVAALFHHWTIKPNGTEGYRTAEVTLGGVDCNALSSKTMESIAVPGLFFIGEAVDVTGWLGGYNFQWAWSSGWAAGQIA
jgi:predicted Rossmann fold flavoprotein